MFSLVETPIMRQNRRLVVVHVQRFLCRCWLFFLVAQFFHGPSWTSALLLIRVPAVLLPWQNHDRPCRPTRLLDTTSSSSSSTRMIHHTAIKTRNITNAINFYSLLGFQITVKFRAGPARAAWLELPDSTDSTATTTTTKTSCRLELIEVPDYMLQEPPGKQRRAVDLMDQPQLLGHNHLALLVTEPMIQLKQPALGDGGGGKNLTTWLSTLNQTSVAQFNRTIRVALPPRQQMIGQEVYELAFIMDADGALVELLHLQTVLEQCVNSGWEPWDGTFDFQQQ